VELGVSLAFVALLVLVLALSAAALARRPADSLAMFALAAPLLLGNQDLLEHAANGMLEVPEAVFTLGATVAWIRARESGTARPWALALLGNALFHVKFQHGLFLAVTVLAVEVLGPGGGERLAAIAAALGKALRRPWGVALLATGLAVTVVGLTLVHAGGGRAVLLGQVVTLGRPRVVRWTAATVAFAFVWLALAADRERLAAALPPRLRFAWSWLLVPMVLWLLVPFTCALETLVTSTTFDSGRGALGLVDRLLFYPGLSWRAGSLRERAGSPSSCCSARWSPHAFSPRVRGQLLPVAAVAGLELAALTVLAGRNLQPRFAVNLASPGGPGRGAVGSGAAPPLAPGTARRRRVPAPPRGGASRLARPGARPPRWPVASRAARTAMPAARSRARFRSPRESWSTRRTPAGCSSATCG
jgi:hypothetical protein